MPVEDGNRTIFERQAKQRERIIYHFIILFVFLYYNSYFCTLIQKFKLMGIIGTLIIGAIAGWLGGTIYKGSGLGLIGNIIIGILGGIVGYWLLGSVFHISLGEGWIGSILTGAIGAIVILFLINLIFKKKK